jgi:hypothetical protein
MNFFIVPNTKGKTRYLLSTDDLWLQRGLRLSSIEGFVPAVQAVNAQRQLAKTSDRPFVSRQGPRPVKNE